MPNLSPSQQPPHNRRFYFKGFTKVCQYMRIAVCHANSYYLNQFIISFSDCSNAAIHSFLCFPKLLYIMPTSGIMRYNLRPRFVCTSRNRNIDQ